jgi:soluble lytic murein transglycosylase-like protein
MLSRPSLRQCLLIGLVSALLPGAGQAAERAGIYWMLDDDNAIHLTDRPRGASRPLVSETATPPSASIPTPIRSRAAAVDAIVRQAAEANALDPGLLHAVIATESGYLNRAVSRRGAQGLMQLMPSTARSLGVTDPFDARQNIGAGARHLRSLLDAFGQDTPLALAAYNAGAAAVTRHGRRIPPLAETTAYVPRVLSRLAALQGTPATAP